MSERVGFMVEVHPHVDRKFSDCFEEITKGFRVSVCFVVSKDILNLMDVPEPWSLPWYSTTLSAVFQETSQAIAAVQPLVKAVQEAKRRFEEYTLRCHNMAETLWIELDNLDYTAKMEQAKVTGIAVHPKPEVVEDESGRKCTVRANVSVLVGASTDVCNLIELAPSVASRWQVNAFLRSIHSEVDIDEVLSTRVIADIVSVADSVIQAQERYHELEEQAHDFRGAVIRSILETTNMALVAQGADDMEA